MSTGGGGRYTLIHPTLRLFAAPEILFAKIEDDAIQQQMSKLEASDDAASEEESAEEAAGYAPLKDEITFERDHV